MTDKVPLAVDLDGTLAYGDVFLKSIKQAIHENPFLIFFILYNSLRGIPHLKTVLEEKVNYDVTQISLNEAVVAYIQKARGEGRPVLLITGSPQKVATKTADFLGYFDGAIGTSSTLNMVSWSKAATLQGLYKKQKFDYIGNSWKDLFVWAKSRKSLIVKDAQYLAPLARILCSEVEII